MLSIFNSVFLLMLLAWFAVLALIGLSIKGAVIAERGVFDLLTTVWFVLFAGCVILFFVRPNIGQYVCAGFMVIWLLVQSINFIPPSPKKAAGYNNTFKNTHHIIPPSDKIAIPDTGHLILLSLLVISLVFMVATIILA